MTDLRPSGPGLEVCLYLESDGQILLTMNEDEAGHFDFAELVREAVEYAIDGSESHAEALAKMEGLNRALAGGLVQVTQKLGPLLQEAADYDDPPPPTEEIDP